MGIKPDASSIPNVLLDRIITSNIANIRGIRTSGAHKKAATKKALYNLGKPILLVMMKDRQIIKIHAA